MYLLGVSLIPIGSFAVLRHPNLKFFLEVNEGEIEIEQRREILLKPEK